MIESKQFLKSPIIVTQERSALALFSACLTLLDLINFASNI